MDIQQSTAMKLSEVNFGEPFFISAFGLVQIGLKVSFDEGRKLPGIIFFTNEGHPDLKVPAVLDAQSYGNESILSIEHAKLRRSEDRATVKFGLPSYLTIGAMILDDAQNLILRCYDGQRSTRDIDTSTWTVTQPGIARSRFWFSSASIVVPCEAGKFREIVSISASADD